MTSASRSKLTSVLLLLDGVLSCSGMKAEAPGVRRDWACALVVPYFMAAVRWDGWFSLLDALVQMGLFSACLAMVVRRARRHRARNKQEVIEAGQASKLKIAVQVVAGLALLMAAAQFEG